MARSIAAAAGGSSRNRGVLMLAVLFGILSAALVFAFLNTQDSGNEVDSTISAADGAQTVLVVTRDVNVGEKITDEMVQSVSVPRGLVLPGYFENSQDVVGKVATTPILKGEQVLTAKVTTFEGQNTLAYKVPEGMRALSVMVPHEAWMAAGLVQPGDRVDVLGITTFEKTDPLTGESKPNITAAIIAEDVEVLAVSQVLVKVVPNLDARKSDTTTTGTADGTATPAADGTSTGAPATVSSDPLKDEATYEKAISVTLAVPPDVAAGVAIIDAMKDDVGQYRIMPRQKGDDESIKGTKMWTLEDILAPKKK